jgi:hypothetical protein
MEPVAISPAPDGWIAVERVTGGVDPTVWVRCQPDEHEGVVVTQMMIHTTHRLTAAALRDVSIGRIEAVINGSPLLREAALDGAGMADPIVGRLRQGKAPTYRKPRKPKRKPLQRPDGSDPEAFYASVASAYREFTDRSSRPAVLMAEEANVPVATARRWISEARRRQALPPGERGRAR